MSATASKHNTEVTVDTELGAEGGQGWCPRGLAPVGVPGLGWGESHT